MNLETEEEEMRRGMVPLEAARLAIIGHFQSGSKSLVELAAIADSIISRLTTAPKSAKQDAAAEAIMPIIRGDEGYKFLTFAEQGHAVVDAVRKADKEAQNGK